MSVTLGFDVYGTLINTHGAIPKLQELIGDKIGNQARAFSQTWREKLLEYSFRRGLMQNYKNFAVCTSDALEYTCAYYKISLKKEHKLDLLDCYQTLPVFEDVKEGLASLPIADFRLYAFSNGSVEAVQTLLAAAGIRDFFLGIVSADDLKSFKPDPAVYRHFLNETGASADKAWLISSNSFDVIGAISAGMNAAWLQRSEESIFDPWGIKPTVIVKSLGELRERIG